MVEGCYTLERKQEVFVDKMTHEERSEKMEEAHHRDVSRKRDPGRESVSAKVLEQRSTKCIQRTTAGPERLEQSGPVGGL